VGSTSGCAVGAGADQGWAWAALAALGLVGRRRRSQASAR
jgi:MYXO-CTERM domain-containing protein